MIRYINQPEIDRLDVEHRNVSFSIRKDENGQVIVTVIDREDKPKESKFLLGHDPIHVNKRVLKIQGE